MKNKELMEKRNDLHANMSAILESAKAETRAMTEDEMKEFNDLEAEIRALDATIEALEKESALEIRDAEKRTSDVDKENEQDAEQRAVDQMDAYIRGDEKRASTDPLSTSNNGAIIPEVLSSDIIRKLTELANVAGDISTVNSTGTYKQIHEADKITAGWTDELAQVTASNATFDTIEIGHHKLGALAKISYELINQADFPIVAEVRTQMVDAFAEKLEDAIFNGTGVKQPTGLNTSGTTKNLAAASAITADEIIEIFYALKSLYRANATWYMSNATLLAIRKLKDSNGQYLFHEAELTQDFDGYILGKRVKTSEKIADFEIYFGDLKKAYKANMNPAMNVQLLNEKYADQGAKGVLGFLFFDGKPVNAEAYVYAKHTV